MVLNPNKRKDGFPSGTVCSVNIRKDVGYPKGCRQIGEPFLVSTLTNYFLYYRVMRFNQFCEFTNFEI